jgi:hypothetical protein
LRIRAETIIVAADLAGAFSASFGQRWLSGAQHRLAERRNQNPPISPELSILVLKKQRNPTDSPVDGLVLHSE